MQCNPNPPTDTQDYVPSIPVDNPSDAIGIIRSKTNRTVDSINKYGSEASYTSRVDSYPLYRLPKDSITSQHVGRAYYVLDPRFDNFVAVVHIFKSGNGYIDIKFAQGTEKFPRGVGMTANIYQPVGDETWTINDMFLYPGDNGGIDALRAEYMKNNARKIFDAVVADYKFHHENDSIHQGATGVYI